MQFFSEKNRCEPLVYISGSCWGTNYAAIHREGGRKAFLECILAIKELAITNCMGGRWEGSGDLKTFMY